MKIIEVASDVTLTDGESTDGFVTGEEFVCEEDAYVDSVILSGGNITVENEPGTSRSVTAFLNISYSIEGVVITDSGAEYDVEIPEESTKTIELSPSLFDIDSYLHKGGTFEISLEFDGNDSVDFSGEQDIEIKATYPARLV